MGIFDWLLSHGEDEQDQELEDEARAAQPRGQTARDTTQGRSRAPSAVVLGQD
jgi:hypothetical protein